MTYTGSKRRIAREILPIILAGRKKSQYFVDLFCGGCNIVDKVPGLRIANDYNYYLIAMWKALISGWQPPDYISEKEYYKIKNCNSVYPDHLVGFAGFACSFGALFFNSYARGNCKNYCKASKNNLIKQVPGLLGVEFKNTRYLSCNIPKNSIIYCDPPYRSTAKYVCRINYNVFYNWCIKQQKHGHSVYISEYYMPSKFFNCVWEKEIRCGIQRAGNRLEKLWVPK